MALNDESNGGIGATMLVGPTGFGGGNYGVPYAVPMMGGNGGFGSGFGGDWSALIILFLFAAMFGGFGGYGMGGMGFGGGFGNMFEFPWLLNGQNGINNNVNDGFRDAQLHDSVTSVRDGVSNLATQLCGCCGDIQMSLANGFAGTTAAVTGAQNAISQQLYSNELANLNRSFAEQTANMQGFNGVQGQLAQGFCDNRAGLADLRYTVATEACADRNAVSNALRDVLAANTASTQRILDQLCQDKIDAKNDEISALRQQIAMKDLAASQTAQNAFIAQGFANEVDQLYNRLNTCPVPTTPVYGRTPIFTCQSSGCGCGGNGGFVN